MATEILVKEPLEKEMIEGGRELVQRLMKTSFKVSAALWLWNREKPYWRLLIASPSAQKKLQEADHKISAALYEKPPFPNWELTDIYSVTNSEPLIKAFRSHAKKYKTNMADKRFKESWFGDVSLEDSYIYFVK